MNTNFYYILGCKMESSLDEIKNGYKIKINKILETNDSELTLEEKNQIKLLKISKFVLTDTNLRKKYNDILNEKSNDFMDTSTITKQSDLSTASRKDLKIQAAADENFDKLSERVFERYMDS